MAQLPREPAEPVATWQPRQQDYFSTDQLQAGLALRAVRGGLVTLATQAFKFALGLAATVLLARLLTPADYGLVGMVAVVVGFVGLFKDLGLSAATVQQEEINDAQVSTLFWVNVIVSLLTGLTTVALAPAVAWFYNEPRLLPVTLAYSVGFLFGGLTVQHEALLKRQMRFPVLATAEIAALLASMTITVAFALRGAGYWALVAGHLGLSFCYMLAVWVSCRWRPGRPRRGAGVRSLLRFGGNLTGFVIINYLARNLDNVLIGRFWGELQLGIYTKAYQLLLLPLDQISSPVASVAVPALSRLNGQPERYRRAYVRILEQVAVLTMPGVALLIATADWVVVIVLGSQWVDSARIFALLGVAALIQPVANSMGWLFTTQGRTREMLLWAPIGSGLIIGGILAGLPWGASGVAAAYSLVFVCVVAPVLFWYVGRRGPVRAWDIYISVLPSLGASLAGLGAIIGYRWLGAPSGAAVDLIISSVIMVGVTFACLGVIPRGRSTLRDSWSTATLLAGKFRTVRGM